MNFFQNIIIFKEIKSAGVHFTQLLLLLLLLLLACVDLSVVVKYF